ncbi:hypothetical protein ACTXT7_008683 [Hymenolepis weldensis]
MNAVEKIRANDRNSHSKRSKTEPEEATKLTQPTKEQILQVNKMPWRSSDGPVAHLNSLLVWEYIIDT